MSTTAINTLTESVFKSLRENSQRQVNGRICYYNELTKEYIDPDVDPIPRGKNIAPIRVIE